MSRALNLGCHQNSKPWPRTPELLPLTVAPLHRPRCAAVSWADVHLLAYLSARLEPPPRQGLVLNIIAPPPRLLPKSFMEKPFHIWCLNNIFIMPLCSDSKGAVGHLKLLKNSFLWKTNTDYITPCCQIVAVFKNSVGAPGWHSP